MESLKNIIPKNGVFVKYVHGFSGKNEIFVIVFKWGSEYFVGFCRKMRAGYGFGSWTGRERRGAAVAGRMQRSAVEDEGDPHLAGGWKVSVLYLFKIEKCADFCITYGKKRYVWGTVLGRRKTGALCLLEMRKCTDFCITYGKNGMSGGGTVLERRKTGALCLLEMRKCADFCITYGKKRYVWEIRDGFGAECSGRRERKIYIVRSRVSGLRDKNLCRPKRRSGAPAVENLCLPR